MLSQKASGRKTACEAGRRRTSVLAAEEQRVGETVLHGDVLVAESAVRGALQDEVGGGALQYLLNGLAARRVVYVGVGEERDLCRRASCRTGSARREQRGEEWRGFGGDVVWSCCVGCVGCVVMMVVMKWVLSWLV